MTLSCGKLLGLQEGTQPNAERLALSSGPFIYCTYICMYNVHRYWSGRKSSLLKGFTFQESLNKQMKKKFAAFLTIDKETKKVKMYGIG